jgi:hypothetical protein
MQMRDLISITFGTDLRTVEGELGVTSFLVNYF